MTVALPGAGAQDDLMAPVTLVGQAGGRLGGPIIALCYAWTAIVLIVAITVQWLHLPSYVLTIGAPNLGPGWTTGLLGTDNVGRSLLARLAYGDRVSVSISFLSTAIALVGGAILGLLQVYFRGIVARIIDLVTNAVLSIPSLLLLLAVVLALQPTLPVLVGAMSLTFVPTFTRLARASGLVQINREYVLAARAMGASGLRLAVREVLPNILGPLVSYAILVLPSIIITEGSLSFLGFGVQPPTPSWGGMIAAAQPLLSTAPWQAILPCIPLFLTVFAVNTLGDALRSRLDISERN
jgi:peptide/nickel transport system permease protein